MNHLRLERQDGGLLFIRLDDRESRVNTLSEAMLVELEAVLGEIENEKADVRALILISQKLDSFIAGADIKELDEKMTRPGIAKAAIEKVHALFGRIEGFPFPVIAAINGACLGGGLELVLACHFRIVTDHPKTLLGLPEVTLGVIPGGGGTQRLTRLIGVKKALPLMLKGKTLNAAQSKAAGIADLVVYPYDLENTVLRCLPLFEKRFGKRLHRLSGYPAIFSIDWLLRRAPALRRAYFGIVRRQLSAQTAGCYPAPFKVVECVATGFARGVAAGLEAEAEAFDELVLSPQSRALRSLFFAQTALKKHPSPDREMPVDTVGVLGAGLMGSGIAAVSVQGGYRAILKDVSRENLARGMKDIWQHFDRKARTARRNPVERDKACSRVEPVLDYGRFAKAGLVIEAVFEDLALKHQVLQEVEPHLPEDAVFASNTSAIPIARIAEASRRPEAVVGMHYFSPVPTMRLLEVVAAPRSADWAVATAVSVGLRQGKTVIVVKDGPGFYTTRILAPYLYEAMRLLEEGAAVEAIDGALRGFGFPVGPLKLVDEVGMEVGAHVAKEMEELFAERGFKPARGLEDLLRAGYRGRKSGAGFYLYRKRFRDRFQVPGFFDFGRPVNKKIYPTLGAKAANRLAPEVIADRLSLLMINEAVLCLGEGIIACPRDGDIGAVLGLGFPPFLGGPFRYLDSIGAEEAVKKLEKYAGLLGARFKPAPLLVEKAERGEKFY